MRITLYKNNCDGKGNSYGTHENYLLSRELDFKAVVAGVVPHFVSRQIIFGAGKVGAETEDGLEQNPAFQLSQRAEFFEEVIGLETTLKRPIVNTRDEPHSDAERFRRLHVIIGDANMSQVATFVKLGSTSLLLSLLEAEGPKAFPSMPVHPVQTVRSFALDTTLTHAVLCEDGKKRTAWDYQDELWNLSDSFVKRTGAQDVASEDEVALILKHWREMLDGVRDDPASVADRVDWVAKLRVVEGLKDRYNLLDNDAKLRAVDLQYHDLRNEKSVARLVGLQELFSHEQASEAVHNPPKTTRAYFRGQCVARYPEQIVAANWDSVVFDLGEGPLQRVPMLDPLRGTAELTQDLLENNATVNALLKAMNG
jgi:proteasome accessory factor A